MNDNLNEKSIQNALDLPTCLTCSYVSELHIYSYIKRRLRKNIENILNIWQQVLIFFSVYLSLRLTNNHDMDYESQRILHSDGEGSIKLCGKNAMSLFWHLKPVVASSDDHRLKEN